MYSALSLLPNTASNQPTLSKKSKVCCRAPGSSCFSKKPNRFPHLLSLCPCNHSACRKQVSSRRAADWRHNSGKLPACLATAFSIVAIFELENLVGALAAKLARVAKTAALATIKTDRGESVNLLGAVKNTRWLSFSNLNG